MRTTNEPRSDLFSANFSKAESLITIQEHDLKKSEAVDFAAQVRSEFERVNRKIDQAQINGIVT